MKKISIIILSLLVTGFGIAPAMAMEHGRDGHYDRSDIMTNSNSASVENCVVTTANTGANSAEGSYAGNGGTAGTISNSGDEDIEDSTTGNGGNAGGSGIGGTVMTGAAFASVDITNMVNRNVINSSEDDANLTNRNRARVANRVMTIADTGDNYASGSYSGTGGDGGSIISNNGEVEDTTTGSGGVGGDAADGGMVVTGEASSNTSILNIVNRNVTRVRR